MPTMISVPSDFAVQPIDPDDHTAVSPATCGNCGLTWDDGIATSWTPVPSGRCPFEYFHKEDEEDEETTADTIRDRLHEAADTLRALGGDDCYDLADACDYAAHHIPS